jgi:hypothetical protein
MEIKYWETESCIPYGTFFAFYIFFENKHRVKFFLIHEQRKN